MILNEGGNVFKDEQNVPETRRINRNEVPGTIAYLQRITGLDLAGSALGSTGISDTSGDIDIGIDANVVTKSAVQGVLVHWCEQQGVAEDKIFNTSKFHSGFIKPGAEINFKCPIEGNANKGYVQVDFMFLINLDWSRWILGAMPSNSKYKGVDRFILLNSIGKAIRQLPNGVPTPEGIKMDGKRGVMNRATDELITTNPDELAQIIIGPQANAKENLAGVEAIIASLRNDPDRDAKVKEAAANFESRGLRLPAMESSAHPTQWFRHLTDRIQ